MIQRTAAERKLVSVMFADIVGSSAMVSGRDPEDADRVLRSVLQVLTDAVDRYGGTVGQMLGDGLLAVFGAPNALEDHALRACLAAQDIRNAALAAGSGFSVRVGIASGEVLAQVIANGVWSDYRTVGECVHLAARLQQRAEPNTALLAHKTVELVPVGLTVQPAGVFQLVPTVEPHPIFSLAGVRARRRTAADLVSADAGPFVGRQRELETLLAAFESASNGVGTVVVLSGEAGIGKSRLVGEAMRMLHGTDHALLQWPQAPIRRLGEPDDLECVAASLVPLADGCDRLCVAVEQAAGSLGLAAVRDLLGLPAADRVWNSLPAAERLSSAIEALVATTVALSQERPILALTEDVHWVGPVMRRFLDTLTSTLNGAGRILLVATTRSESGTNWSPGVEAMRIPLEALPPEPTHEFLDRWLGHDPSVADLKAMVAAKSQGVPLYLEESLRALEMAGAIFGIPGHYRLGTAARMVQLPASVHGLLAARIDSLDAASRQVLLTAAVIGPTFDVALLRRLEPVPETALAGGLAKLEEAGFIRRSRLIPNLEYNFRHGLIQEVAYGTITRNNRRTLHANILEALRERRDHDLPGRAELLALHAYRAEVWTAAYVYGRHAGQRAEERSKLEEASQHYTNALAALKHLEPSRRNTLRMIDLSIALPRTLLPRGMTGVDDQLSRARELALSIGDPLRFARAASLHAAFEWSHGDIEKALQLSREGLGAVSGSASLTTRIPLLIRLGGILAEKGLFHDGCTAVEEARRLLALSHTPDLYGMAAVSLVVANGQHTRCLAELGESAAAIRAGMEGVDVAEESGHTFSKVYAQGHMGWTFILLGETERSLPPLENALALSELARSYLHQPFIMGALGYAHVRSGNREHGQDLLERSANFYRNDPLKLWSQQVIVWSAEALLHLGQIDEAIAEAGRALQLARDAGRMGYQARAAAVYAEALAAAQWHDANTVKAVKDAEALARRLSMRLVAERCARLLDRLSSPRPVRAL
ncbi:MAG TPA: adenylate/guanylate cyclase domain-containing protein [Azospirillum sp.]|nr:adenylate/guanylate cyclase domain-containing protein [Azospirillum sp.]